MFNREKIESLEKEIRELKHKIANPKKKIVVSTPKGIKELIGTGWKEPGTYYYPGFYLTRSETLSVLTIYDGDERIATFREWDSIVCDGAAKSSTPGADA